MTLTIKLDGNWSSFQLANSTPPLSVTDSAIAPSARMHPRAATQVPVFKVSDRDPLLLADELGTSSMKDIESIRQ